MKPPHHSPAAIAAHPAPVREHYFTSADYATACMRVHEHRLKFDGQPIGRGRKRKGEA